MDFTHLTAEQRAKVNRLLMRQQEQIGNLIKRMRERGWYTNDGALRALTAAEMAIGAAREFIGLAEKLPPPKVPEPATGGWGYPASPQIDHPTVEGPSVAGRGKIRHGR